MPTLSSNEYAFLLELGIPYEGHVEGLGQVYTIPVVSSNERPICGASTMGTFKSTNYMPMLFNRKQQRDANAIMKTIYNNIVKVKINSPNNTQSYEIIDPINNQRIAMGKHLTEMIINVQDDNLKISIKGENGDSFEYETNDVDTFTSKLGHRTKDFVLNYSSEINKGVYMLGISANYIGNHMDKRKYFRPIITTSGSVVNEGYRLWKFGFISGTNAMRFSKIGGGVAGYGGLGFTLYYSYVGSKEYFNNPNSEKAINPAKSVIDVVFGVLGLIPRRMPIGLSFFYYGVDLIRPGGWKGVFMDESEYYKGNPYMYHKD
ncbi:MAG: hypothetical protein RL662_2223 [Bacteroidota bacterium]|jgi:hypothetical protein